MYYQKRLSQMLDYLFFDESYPCGEKRTIVMSAWSVEQPRLNRASDPVSSLFRPPVLERIESMLQSLDAWGVVTTAALESDLYRFGETDATSDVPAMTRADNIWSQCAIFTVGALLRCLFAVGQEVGTVDVHFDPKDLKAAHLSAIERTLRELMPRIAREYAAERNSSLLKKLQIRRFQPVPKKSHGECGDKFQIGTWVADKLCSNAGRIGHARQTRILKLDMSDVVRRTIQQWDGIPFYASNEHREVSS
jgi:hypothetical protein